MITARTKSRCILRVPPAGEKHKQAKRKINPVRIFLLAPFFSFFSFITDWLAHFFFAQKWQQFTKTSSVVLQGYLSLTVQNLKYREKLQSSETPALMPALHGLNCESNNRIIQYLPTVKKQLYNHPISGLLNWAYTELNVLSTIPTNELPYNMKYRILLIKSLLLTLTF